MCQQVAAFVLRWGLRASLVVLLVGLGEFYLAGQAYHDVAGIDFVTMMRGVLVGDGIETMRLSIALLVGTPLSALIAAAGCAGVAGNRRLVIVAAGVLGIVILAMLLRF